MKFNLFIDTNIFLNFYRFGEDQLARLEEFVTLLKRDEISLFLPQQVKDEFNRRRASVLKEALGDIEKLFPKFAQPMICRNTKQMVKIQELLIEARTQQKSLLVDLRGDIAKRNLNSDKLINEIFENASVRRITQAILTSARNRFDRGNPPGKNHSYGDAIIWESLLTNCPKRQDLHFVGGDGDFRSELDRDSFSEYLDDEWRSVMHSRIFHYDLLSQFIKDNFPSTKITKADISFEKEVVEQYPFVSMQSEKIEEGLSHFYDFSATQRGYRCPNCAQMVNLIILKQRAYVSKGITLSQAKCPNCGFEILLPN